MSYRRMNVPHRLRDAASSAVSSIALVGLLSLGALVAFRVFSAQASARTHRQFASSRTPVLPERLQTWEGEGGGLTEGSHQADARPSARHEPL